MVTLGIRNNNPLNIRYNPANHWQGKIEPQPSLQQPLFEQFVSMRYGFLAALNLIGNTYILRYLINTPEGIIRRWAPPSENDTEAYIRHVCRYTGLGGQEPLSNADPRLRNLVLAMAIIESGEDIHYHRADLDDAWALYRPQSAYRRKRN